MLTAGTSMGGAQVTAYERPEIVSWRTRLMSAGSGGGSDAADPPEWFGRSVLELTGIEGMHQLSNLGVLDAVDPGGFRAALLRAPVGELLLFSTLETPHTVTYDRSAAAGQRDIVILGTTGHGGLRLITDRGVERMSVGRMGFLSSFAPSVVEHVGLTETTGVVIPVDLIIARGDRLAAGVGLFPDNPMIRTIGAAFRQMLVETLASRPHSRRDEAEAESMLLGLVQVAMQQLHVATESMNHAAEMRVAARQVIERRHADPGFVIEDLAAELHISRRQLYRYFNGFRPAPRELLLQRRLATARMLLLDPQDRDTETLARAAGFIDAASLRAHFRRQFGMSPSDLRHDPMAGRTVARAMLLADEQSAGVSA